MILFLLKKGAIDSRSAWEIFSKTIEDDKEAGVKTRRSHLMLVSRTCP